MRIYLSKPFFALRVNFMNRILRSSKELGETIRSIRKNQRLGQAELAHKAAVRQALISDIEKGVVATRLDTLLKILAALNADLAIIPRFKSEFNPADY